MSWATSGLRKCDRDRGGLECIDERATGEGAVEIARIRQTAPTAELAERAERVAAIAAQHAAAVDRDSLFPADAIAAARRERLLSAAVPRELGGEGEIRHASDQAPPRHKVPVAISFVPALRVAASGKLLRRQG
jgi:hypothetical protein